MTDPTYGDNPIDPGARWDQLMRPPLVNDDEVQALRTVVVAMMLELLESSWSVRWRVGSVLTSEGVHLDAVASDFKLLRPDGWSDDRWRAALIPIDAAFLSNRTVDGTKALAAGLAQPGQTWEIDRPGNLEYIVYFFGITADEAEIYREILEFGRPKGVGFTLVWSAVPKADTFVWDVSLYDGPDTRASP